MPAVLALVTLAVAGALMVVAVGLPPTARERVMAALTPFGRLPAALAAARLTAGPAPLLARLADGPLGAAGPAMTGPRAVRRLQRWLEYAGSPPAWPLARLIRARSLGLCGGVAAGLFFGTAWAGVAGLVAGVPLGAAIGAYLVDLLLLNAAQKRQEQMLKHLPDALDALVIGVEAGLGLDAAMAQVATYTTGPIAAELTRTLQEMRIGSARATALRALADRTTIRELRTLLTALLQSGELGIPIADVLREHSRETRMKRRQRAEEMAQKVPVKILLPVLLCIFPAMFVIILGPGFLNLMKTFGH
ncbi:type II secretion system F family protein [Dactylosporangium matsuzakiense]|uniref:type II secretion system F family protein n=1 Tax=Dactylosporangium matsuzakiense TaxID=53360 RepID=UPI0021C34A44|nr:type II secretion system F family protein [Dactylosporangium matsuzakiense]UWZ48626.1 type II secretion system F family protein [Dactylosporangium matsuzakiense]